MKVTIRGVEDNGNHANERIVFDVLEKTDIGEYVVLDTTYTNGGNVSNHARHPFWFPDEKMEAGDAVVLYTKKGNYSNKPMTTGKTMHFFFWGLNNSVWNNEGDCAVLLHVNEWIHKRVNR